MNITDSAIFKACDIRGLADTQFTAEDAFAIGRALASAAKGGAFVVGGDVRLSTPSLKASLIKGLLASGADVTDVGIVPTPALYFAKRHLGFNHCAMVTASHNPPAYNGVKFVIDNQPTVPAVMDGIAQRIESGDFRDGDGTLAPRPVLADYVNWLVDTFEDRFERKLTVLVDAGNGCYGEVAPEVFRRLGHTVIELGCEPDGAFPGRSPNPAVFENLTQATATMQSTSTELGIAFDGDGDRVIFLDESGTPIASDRIAVVLAKALFSQYTPGPVVYDLKCSSILAKAVESADGEALMERAGHSFIRRRMMATDAIFGAEISGHLFFRELDYGDDGLYAALCVAAILSRGAKSMSAQMTAVPVPHITADIRITVTDTERDTIIDAFANAFAHLPATRVDGLRVDWDDGWALCRTSVTEPVVTMRFEADTAERLAEIVEEVKAAVPMAGTALDSI